MATTPNREQTDLLRTSSHDQVSGLLLSVLGLLGFATALMLIVWFTSRFVWTHTVAVPVQILEDVGGGGSGSGGTGAEEKELEEPKPEESQEFKEPDPEQMLNALSAIVAQDVELVESTKKSGYGKGQGTGIGDGRGPGPGGPGTSDGIPAWERWEVRMSATNINDYAAQLDFFKVELGVAGGGSTKVDYVSNLSRNRPTVRAGDPNDEKRIRFMHRASQLRAADRSLAEKGGVATQGRIVFQFYPPEMYNQLLALENKQMGTRRIKDVRRTIFGVRGTAGKYEFYVLSQEYRAGA